MKLSQWFYIFYVGMLQVNLTTRTMNGQNAILDQDLFYGTVQIKIWSISGRYCSQVWCLSEPCVRDH